VVVCRDRREGKIAGMGISAVRSLSVNGSPREIGYLFGLRARPEYVRATTVLHRGYARLRELEARPPCFYLTSILEENLYARRLLEKKRPFMPSYEPLCSYTVFAMAAGRRRRAVRNSVRPASASDLPRLLSFLCEHGTGQQFFPVVTVDSFDRPPFNTLRPEDFLLCERQGRVVAAAALWDQCSYRQFRVTGYGGLLRLVRPLSALLPLCGLPALPRAGEDVGYLTLCLPAARGNDPALFEELLDGALAAAYRAPVLVAGAAAGHPLEAVLASRRHIGYRSRIYLVFWPEQAAAAAEVRRDMPLHIECGLL
jgi:hypothetical protein